MVCSSLADIKAIAKSVEKFLIFSLQLPSNIVSLFKHFGRKRFQKRPKQTAKRYSQWYDDRANNEQTNKIEIVKLRQTILKSEQHTTYITIGQRVSLHSLPTLCFLFFAQRTFFCFSATAQVAHLGLPDTRPNASQNQKSHFFCQRKCQVLN
jgi:hypothetical protein